MKGKRTEEELNILDLIANYFPIDKDLLENLQLGSDESQWEREITEYLEKREAEARKAKQGESGSDEK